MQAVEINVIHRFDYPSACIDIELTDSKAHLLSIGVYKPMMRIFDLNNMTLKLERHMDADPVKIRGLSEDGTKLAILRNDRKVEFHAKYGLHDTIRMPMLCNDICLNKTNADLIAGGSSVYVQRFNLDQGRFLKPYVTTIEEIACIHTNNAHGLIGIAGDSKIQFVDPRDKKIIAISVYKDDVTAFGFADNGLDFAVGLTDGNVMIQDLRSKEICRSYAHNSSVRKIKYNNNWLVSADKNSIKVADKTNTMPIIETQKPITAFDTSEGLIYVGLDNPKMSTYFVEELGCLPEWAKLASI